MTGAPSFVLFVYGASAEFGGISQEPAPAPEVAGAPVEEKDVNTKVESDSQPVATEVSAKPHPEVDEAQVPVRFGTRVRVVDVLLRVFSMARLKRKTL
jgi:hypothetical protein